MAPQNGSSSTMSAPPAPPQKATNCKTYYVVRHPWKWVMQRIDRGMTELDYPSELPTLKLAAEEAAAATPDGAQPTPTTPSSRRRSNRGKDRANAIATLKFEIVDAETGELQFAAHGTSSAFDGLEDKDELVRTIQRCRVEELALSPPSILINWDVTREECFNVIGKGLPKFKENNSDHVIAVLKEPMGSQGRGIFFVSEAEEIHKIISEQRQRALDEPHFLDNLIAQKGRIPSWVVQAEVAPAMLIRERKFHVRTYLLLIEQPHLEGWLEMFIYKRHEVRIAGVPVGKDTKDRDPLAHITNGALSNSTERKLINDVPELKQHQDNIETFVASTFGKHLLPDISRRVGVSYNQNKGSKVKLFAFAGLDLMLTTSGKIYLLEANVNPAAPPLEMVDDDFLQHLVGMMEDLVDVVMGKDVQNFLSVEDILVEKGLLG